MDPATPVPNLIGCSATLATGALSSVDLVRWCLARIEQRDGSLRAFTQVFADEALADAQKADTDRAKAKAGGAPLGPLAGIPIAIKDNLCTLRGRTTCASKYLEHYCSPFEATAVRKLREAGAIIIGKTNLDEFAMGGSGEHSAFGPTRHPLDSSRVPGGSSSGSACAVGAGLVPAALGSDTGGSIRQPAGWCGITGCKPTYGRVSRYGLVAYASSLDQIGPIASDAASCHQLLSVIAGHDPNDSTSAPDQPAIASLSKLKPGLCIGIPAQAKARNSAGVQRAMEQTIAKLLSAGHRTTEVDLPHADAAIAAYYIIATAEASSNLSRYDGVRYGKRADPKAGDSVLELYTRSRTEALGAEVQKRIMLGTHVLSSGYYDAYYLTALKARRLIWQDYQACFAQGCHALLMPTSPGPAFRFGAKADPLSMYLEDIYTVGVNLAGLPAVATPAGTEHADGIDLPVGVQFIGPAMSDELLLSMCAELQSA